MPKDFATRFEELRRSGLSTHDAWNVIAIDILAEYCLVKGQHLALTRASKRVEESGKIPVMEAKLTKIIRLEPGEDDRIQREVRLEAAAATASREDRPSQSSVIRQAISLGLDELERRRARK